MDGALLHLTSLYPDISTDNTSGFLFIAQFCICIPAGPYADS